LRTTTVGRLQQDDGVLLVDEAPRELDGDVRDRPVGTVHRNPADRLADALPLDQDPEDRVVEVEVPLRSFGDEELRIVGVVLGLRHREDARPIVLQIDVELIVELSERRAAGAGPRGIASLDHEVVDHPMKDDAVVEARVGELDDMVRRAPRRGIEELEHHLPEARDPHAETAIAGENRGRDERIARLDGVGERPLTFRIQHQQQRRAPAHGNIPNGRKGRLSE
jgi:hypothetical protein